MERPGAKLGAPCAADEECSSTACIGGRCVQLCEREAACPEGQTCTLDRTAEELRGYCVARRGTSPPLTSCRSDAGCDRGSCLMGVCLTLCQTPGECGGGRTCGRLPAPLERLPLTEWPELRACLPRNQNLTTDISEDQPLLVPDTARSVLLFMSADNYDEQTVVGLRSFRTATGRFLFQLWNENDPAGYFRNPIRHYPDVGCSSFLFSSSPQRAPVRMGPYPFRIIAQDVRGIPEHARVQAIYKLFDAPIQRGRMALRIHITNLSGLPSGCRYRDLRASNAEQMLGPILQRVKEIFAQSTVGIQLAPISFVDSSAPSSVNVNTPGSLGNVLRTASMDTAGGADLILLRSISPHGVLGIAGGIPGSPGIKGTPHTGAVVSMLPLCLGQFSQEAFAVTMAHEMGHTLGLSHNREQNGQSDPLGDGNGRSESYLQDTANLMYWAEGANPGSLLTAEQGEVIRHMPQVQP
ncbi:MAG: zinc-dependent metalloprotease family protein [Myxococcales bacterium]|nr:hypothetical protein [Myxococcota bacterium]MDW8281604.1 zinc-dependent metalloprotease family protein [Myxococcales bacterium]